MKQKQLFEHHAFYFFELLMLLAGFLLIIIFSYSVIIQFMILMFVLMSYITLGFIHHHINHDLRAKIVLEYVLISSLILVAFLFLNSSRL